MVYIKQNYGNARKAAGFMATGYGMVRSGVSSAVNRTSRSLGFGSQSSQMVVRQPPRKRMRSNSFHAKLFKLENCQHNYLSGVTYNTALLHNTVYTANWSNTIGQSTTQGGRMGNDVYFEAIRYSMFYASPAASQNGVQLRLITFYCDRQVAPTGLSNTGGFGINIIFGGQTAQTGTDFATNGLTDPQRITVLDDRKLIINPQVTGVQDTVALDFEVPLKNTFVFESASGNFGKTKNLYFCVIACQVGGASGTSNAGNINVNADLIFKNVK